MMPQPASILADLAAAAQRFWPAALAWHLVILLALAALVAGWRPRRSVVTAALALPLASVAVFAALARNPFNASLFSLAAGATLWLARRMSHALDRERSIAPGVRWQRALGIMSIAFAWVYPHFLGPRPAVWYLFAAPVGIVPCPTLALVSGIVLSLGGLRSRALSLGLAALALFYGLFGLVRLGVGLDVGLLIAAAALFETGRRCPTVRAELSRAEPGRANPARDVGDLARPAR